MAFMDDKITLVADYYVKKNVDMIVDERLPLYFGVTNGYWYANPTAISLNSAEIKNSGVEFGLNYRNNVNGFSYDIGANITTIQNEVTKLDKDILGGGDSRLTITKEGQSIGEFYGWTVDGIFQNQEEIDALNTTDEDGDLVQYQTGAAPGDFKFRDWDDNGKIDANDRTSLGKAFPNLIYGFNLNGSYKGFDLSVVFNGVNGNQIFNQNKLAAGISGGGTSGNGIPNKPKEWVNRWQGEGTSNTIPRAVVTDPNNNKRPSSFFVEDGSYFRLRNVQFGYNIASGLTERLGLNTFRFYISAQNLFTITKYSGYSPDLGSKNQDNTYTGIDLATYPQSKTYTLGLTLGF